MSIEIGEQQPRAAERGGWRLRNWRVRARLVALILIPTAAAVLLGGVQVINSTSAAGAYSQANLLAQFSDRVGALTHRLSAERARTSWYIALGRPTSAASAVRDQMNEVDKAAEKVRESARLLGGYTNSRTGDEIETVLTRLDDLSELRNQALDSELLPGAAIDLYTTVIGDLISINDELGKGSEDDVLVQQSVTLDALARAKESVSLQHALLTTVLVAGRFEQDQLQRFLGELAREQNERKAFTDDATSDERRFYDETVNAGSAERAQFLRELILIRAGSGVSLRGLDRSKRDDAREWFDAMKVVVDALRTVEQRQATAIVTRTEELSSNEQQRAYVVAAAVAALLIVVLLITTGVARSLERPLRLLRSEALEIAGRRLPDFVQRLRESRGGAVPSEVAPIGVFTKDEVGEVARAFDEVHREAVRLAGDEAQLRANVNAMFVNLSRRSQALVERQLTLIERLERGERDDNRLGDLFKLDHLATRMRRNSENLLVLAGQDAARKWSQPVELIDVVRASQGEVESYDRVVTHVRSEVAIAGQAVSDIVHLLAELVENAVSFSPRDTKVVISSNRIDDGGLMISITDQGIGMNAADLGEANWRLANPPVVDVSVSRRMGLFVVGRLALRHNIRIQLRQHDVAGLTAIVLIPETLLAPIPGQTPVTPQATISAPTGPAGYGHPSLDPPPPVDTLDRSHPRPASVPTREGPRTDGTWFAFDSTPPVEASPFDQGAFGPVGPPSADFPAFSQPGPLDRRLREELRRDPREMDATRPLPRLETSPMDTGEEEYLPIFASVESGWFKKVEPVVEKPVAAKPAVAKPAAEKPATGDVWSSPADSGWRAAAAVSEPSHGGVTASGLPKREPKANLVPGTVAPAASAPPSPAPPISPDRIRSRLASFQQGIRKGRAEIRNEEES
ncbi:sensor histidine kinase [Sphaerisporangium perillae]|uniref:sensor histidine kinase n=1 Tax=Sphaerisporangium perillae TaxID=2935860 RepID=UPI00200F3D7C|nr:nitrate- and nitrite sensing domain-containing protein [Sphaerisporangium perillae]